MACRCQERRDRLVAAVKGKSPTQVANALVYSVRTMAEDAGRVLVRKGRGK